MESATAACSDPPLHAFTIYDADSPKLLFLQHVYMNAHTFFSVERKEPQSLAMQVPRHEFGTTEEK